MCSFGIDLANWPGPSAYSTGDLTFNYLTMKTITYNRQATPHISYVHIHTLGYKIKTLTLLKEVNFTKQNTLAKLAGNSVL